MSLPTIFDNLPPGVTKLDVAEAIILVNGGAIEQSASTPSTLPVAHRFTPGMYIREIYMTAGSVLTSKIHKTEHPFVISQGMVSVYNEEDGSATLLCAPYTGITKAGTRRLLYVHQDTVWTTFHATQCRTVEEVEDEIMESRVNPMLVTDGLSGVLECRG